MPSPNPPLPDFLRPFFWDTPFDELSWEEHAHFITRRILRAGDWHAIGWLRRLSGDDALRQWLTENHGGGLNPRQLRFWMIVLNLDPVHVDNWIKRIKQSPWEKRIQR